MLSILSQKHVKALRHFTLHLSLKGLCSVSVIIVSVLGCHMCSNNLKQLSSSRGACKNLSERPGLGPWGFVAVVCLQSRNLPDMFTPCDDAYLHSHIRRLTQVISLNTASFLIFNIVQITLSHQRRGKVKRDSTCAP